MKRTFLAPLTLVYTTLIIAGVVLLIQWLASGGQVAPDIAGTIFAAFPFALVIVTVRNVYRQITPSLFLLFCLAISLVVVLLTPLFTLDVSPNPRTAAEPIPQTPFFVWRNNEIVYAAESEGRTLQILVVADRESTDQSPRLTYETARSVPYEERYAPNRLDLPTTTDRLTRDIADTRFNLDAVRRPSLDNPFPLSREARNWLPPVLWGRWYGVTLAILWSIALVLVWTPARATRWPLLNLILGLAYVRVLLAVPRLTDFTVQLPAVSSRLSPIIRSLGMPIILMVLIVIAGVGAILLPRVDRRDRGGTA